MRAAHLPRREKSQQGGAKMTSREIHHQEGTAFQGENMETWFWTKPVGNAFPRWHVSKINDYKKW